MARDDYDDLLEGLADPGKAPTREEPSRPRGRPKDPESLTSQLKDGTAKQLKAIIPTALFRRLKAQASLQERQISDIVKEAVYVWLEEHEEWPGRDE